MFWSKALAVGRRGGHLGPPQKRVVPGDHLRFERAGAEQVAVQNAVRDVVIGGRVVRMERGVGGEIRLRLVVIKVVEALVAASNRAYPRPRRPPRRATRSGTKRIGLNLYFTAASRASARMCGVR